MWEKLFLWKAPKMTERRRSGPFIPILCMMDQKYPSFLKTSGYASSNPPAYFCLGKFLSASAPAAQRCHLLSRWPPSRRPAGSHGAGQAERQLGARGDGSWMLCAAAGGWASFCRLLLAHRASVSPPAIRTPPLSSSAKCFGIANGS